MCYGTTPVSPARRSNCASIRSGSLTGDTCLGSGCLLCCLPSISPSPDPHPAMFCSAPLVLVYLFLFVFSIPNSRGSHSLRGPTQPPRIWTAPQDDLSCL